PITYLHPKLEPILKKTYGIAVYQEQLMEIARELAGFTFSEADTLRKAVGKKIRSLLQEQSEKLIQGMIQNGIEERKAKEIWHWFEPFARYGFNRSHATCYALIGYRTAYLKAHYPLEFHASLLNAEAGDIDRIAFLVGEARKAGIEVYPPDINKSFVRFAPEQNGIRFGLLAIKNLGSQIANAIVEERSRNGAFANLADFLSRIQHKDLNKKSLESLIKSGALDSLGVDRGQALFNIDELIKFIGGVRKSAASNQHSLFGAANTMYSIKLKPAPAISSTELLAWEKELLGFYLSDHPLSRFADQLKKYRVVSIQEALTARHAKVVRIAGLIAKIQRAITKKGDPMMFVQIEDFSPQPIEVLVFNSVLEQTMTVWRENIPIIIQGKISRRNGEPKLICDAVKVLG
ncbi:DNA polymerase III subunit alpha, partial [Candidatus Parcubacteria bacterium]